MFAAPLGSGRLFYMRITYRQERVGYQEALWRQAGSWRWF